MRPLCYRRLLALLAMLLPLPILAAPTAYVSAWNTLYRLDLATAQATRIGTGIGFNDVEGLAFAPDGTLYGVADGTIGNGSALTDFLIRIDTNSGVGTLIGPLQGLAGEGPSGQLDYGLSFSCDGRLWASSDTTGRFWEINPHDGQVTEIGDTGAPLSDITTIGKQMYGIGVRTGFGDPAQQALYRVDPVTATAVRIGSLGVADNLSSAGMDFDANGTLWATLDSQPPDYDRASRLARINPVTGQATVVGSITGITDNLSVRALAITTPGPCTGVDVPKPAALVQRVPSLNLPGLLLLGLLALGIGGLRLRSLH